MRVRKTMWARSDNVLILCDTVSSWAVVVPATTTQDVQVVHETSLASSSDGWRFLLQHGSSLAMIHNVKPEQLILGASYSCPSLRCSQIKAISSHSRGYRSTVQSPRFPHNAVCTTPPPTCKRCLWYGNAWHDGFCPSTWAV